MGVPIIGLIEKPATPNPHFSREKPLPSTSWAPHRVFNIGNANPVPLMSFVSTIEKITNKTAKKSFSPMHIGDVPRTFADTSKLEAYINYKPNTPIDIGIKKSTGKSSIEHAISLAEKHNPERKKVKCVNFLEITETEVCTVLKKRVSELRKKIDKHSKVKILD